LHLPSISSKNNLTTRCLTRQSSCQYPPAWFIGKLMAGAEWKSVVRSQ
jgi:hypothetical protein